MRNRLRRLRSAVRRRIRYRITRGGLLFTLAVLLVAAAAAVSTNNLMYLILATMISTMLVSGFISRLCLAGLELDFQIPEHIPAGRSVPARLYVRNHKWVMPSFSIRVEPLRAAGLETGVYFPLAPAGSTVSSPRNGSFRALATPWPKWGSTSARSPA